MQQITITIELTTKNLELLKALCASSEKERIVEPAQEKAPADNIAEPVPEKVIAAPVQEKVIAEPAQTVNTTEKVDNKISLTDVRAIALKLSKAGKQEFLKAAFAKFGAKKLSDIAPDNYSALMTELSKEVTDNA